MIRLSDFKKIVVFAGAGLSHESGVPTYRGRGGTWDDYHPAQVASPEAYRSDPRRVWEFHRRRLEAIRACEPNAAHRFFAELQWSHDVTLVTQNVDGLLQRAGALNVLELHGNLERWFCGECYADGSHQREQCSCGGWMRPDVVWFGEKLDPRVLIAAKIAMLQCDLLVSVGTSAMVAPVSTLPLLALDRKIMTLEINLQDTDISHLYTRSERVAATRAPGTVLVG